MINPVVYKITCIPSGKVYVGSTTNFSRRKQGHLDDLRRDKHHSRPLQQAWSIYGESNFEFFVIEETSIDKYREREQYWIDQYNSSNLDFGFNRQKDVWPNSRTYSYLKEDEVKEIISQLEQGVVRKKLAEKYRISAQTISDIEVGRSWSYLPRGKIRWGHGITLSDCAVEEIKSKAKSGKSQYAIAAMYKVNQSTISRIISQKRRKEIRYANV